VQHDREKKKEGAPECNKNAEKQLSHNDTVESTAERLAKQHNVSRATINRDAAFSKAIDTITANTAPEVKHKMLNGEIDINRIQFCIENRTPHF
jgi:FKBP-type peptidyl-prolyl cis-trans isomerase (trigger factor)